MKVAADAALWHPEQGDQVTPGGIGDRDHPRGSSDRQARHEGLVARAQPAEKHITNSFGMKLVLIPAGKFLMGSPAKEAERDDEELQHEVVISKPFYMGAYEVTQGQMQKSPPKYFRPVFDAKNGGGPDHPMENVSFNDVVAFNVPIKSAPLVVR